VEIGREAEGINDEQISGVDLRQSHDSIDVTSSKTSALIPHIAFSPLSSNFMGHILWFLCTGLVCLLEWLASLIGVNVNQKSSHDLIIHCTECQTRNETSHINSLNSVDNNLTQPIYGNFDNLDSFQQQSHSFKSANSSLNDSNTPSPSDRPFNTTNVDTASHNQSPDIAHTRKLAKRKKSRKNNKQTRE
jgi:hypothetical protein